LALLEDSVAPVRDDIVNFDGVPELINDYFAAANSIVRTVNETDVDNGNGTRTFTVTVTGTNPATGGPGDLWPSGFVSGTTPLPNGGFGIGLNLPASLGGAEPLGMSPGDAILSATVAISTSGVFGAASNLPSGFFNGAASYPVPNWNGVIGIAFTNGATGTAIQDGIRLSVTYVIPEPASLSLVGVGALALVRRRR
jgi:hypothetical protein